MTQLWSMQYINRPESYPTYDYTKWIDRILRCRRRPPQEFMDRTVEEAKKFHSVSKPRWVEDPQTGEWLLTGDRLPNISESMVGQYAYEACVNLFEGYYNGYLMALGPCKPYFLDVPNIKWIRHSLISTNRGQYDFELPKIGKITRVYFATEAELTAEVERRVREYDIRIDAAYNVRHRLDEVINGYEDIKWTLELVYGFDFDREYHF